MTKRLTFALEPEGNELFDTQVDDLCGRRVALVTKRNDGRHSLLFIYAGSIVAKKKKQFTRGGSKKVQVSNSSMGMSWGVMEKREEGIL